MDEQLFLACPECNEHAEYGGGSSFYCPKCQLGFKALTEDEIVEHLEDWDADGRLYVCCDDAVTAYDLADWAAATDHDGQNP